MSSRWEGFWDVVVSIFVGAAIALTLIFIGFGIWHGCDGYMGYSLITKSKPYVTWRYEAHGQKLDTVWIYKFKEARDE